MSDIRTVGDLRAWLAGYPDETPVLTTAYEYGLIAIASVSMEDVYQQDAAWLDGLAPMMGTHDYSNKTPPDKVIASLPAVIIHRTG